MSILASALRELPCNFGEVSGLLDWAARLNAITEGLTATPNNFSRTELLELNGALHTLELVLVKLRRPIQERIARLRTAAPDAL